MWLTRQALNFTQREIAARRRHAKEESILGMVGRMLDWDALESGYGTRQFSELIIFEWPCIVSTLAENQVQPLQM